MKEKEDKVKRDSKPKIKFWAGLLFKIALIILGILNLFDILGHVGDLFAIAALFMLWLEFNPVKLIFGNTKKWLNFTIILIFYIFILDTILQVFRTVDVHSPEFQLIYHNAD